MNPLLLVTRYDTFGALVADDILNSYPKDSQLVGVARAMIAVVVTLCYPLQSHPSRGCALVVILDVARYLVTVCAREHGGERRQCRLLLYCTRGTILFE